VITISKIPQPKPIIIMAIVSVLMLSMSYAQTSEGVGSRGPLDEPINVPFGGAVVNADGIKSPGEWADSNTPMMWGPPNGTYIYLNTKEDGSHFLISLECLAPSEFKSMSLFIDPNNGSEPSGEAILLTIDEFYGGEFHWSAGDWNPVSESGWLGSFRPGFIEISIDLDKLTITPGYDKVLRISMYIMGDKWNISWPDPFDSSDPSTWAMASSSDLWDRPNNLPMLEEGTVNPSLGFTDDTFEFSVIYSDADSTAPTVKNVVIDGIDHDMTYVEDTGSGYLYDFKTRLDPGDHLYHFNFSDGYDFARFPSSGDLIGPMVYVPNNPPMMDRGSIPNGTYTLDEDQMYIEHLIDLEEFFSDDRDDGNMTFTVVYQENPDVVEARIDGRFLNVEQKVLNWHGELRFQVEAADKGILGLDVQRYQLRSLSNPFIITVRSINDPPSIVSLNGIDVLGQDTIFLSEEEGATQDVPFTIEIKTDDIDMTLDQSEELAFAVNDSSVQITKTGKKNAELSFTPTDVDIGLKYLNLTVTDKTGTHDSIDVIVKVLDTNDPPIIVSCLHLDQEYPVVGDRIRFDDGLSAIEDEEFGLRILAIDPDLAHGQEKLVYSLLTPREDVEIDPDTGELRFYPDQLDVGMVKIRVSVADRLGFSDETLIEIPVVNMNDPPIIKSSLSSTGEMTFIEGEDAYLTLDFSDSDIGYDPSEHFTVRWVSDRDGDLGIGEILKISGLSVGIHIINVTINDAMGASDSYSFQIELKKDQVVYHPDPIKGILLGGGIFATLLSAIVLVLVSFFFFSKISEKTVLDNMNRKVIYDTIKKKPGIHFMALSVGLSLVSGVLSHHLNILEKKGFIKSIQDGKYRRFYLYDEKIEFKLTLTAIQQTILFAVKQDPGISQTGISEMIGKNKMVVNYHIKILKDVGLLSVERNGRETNCFATNAAFNLL
jgi:predicted transcriptional regulator